MYTEDVAKFACVLFTTTGMTFDCGWQWIQIRLRRCSYSCSSLGAGWLTELDRNEFKIPEIIFDLSLVLSPHVCLLRNVVKRGPASVTKSMLTERDLLIDAERASGQPSVWRDAYRTMRCPGPPCQHEGQYCWQDPVEKKHYKLRTHHLKSLVKFVERGGIIESHDDVPEDFPSTALCRRAATCKTKEKLPSFNERIDVSSGH